MLLNAPIDSTHALGNIFLLQHLFQPASKILIELQQRWRRRQPTKLQLLKVCQKTISMMLHFQGLQINWEQKKTDSWLCGRQYFASICCARTLLALTLSHFLLLFRSLASLTLIVLSGSLPPSLSLSHSHSRSLFHSRAACQFFYIKFPLQELRWALMVILDKRTPSRLFRCQQGHQLKIIVLQVWDESLFVQFYSTRKSADCTYQSLRIVQKFSVMLKIVAGEFLAVEFCRIGLENDPRSRSFVFLSFAWDRVVQARHCAQYKLRLKIGTVIRRWHRRRRRWYCSKSILLITTPTLNRILLTVIY